jgi:hypothetical protein
MSGEAFAITESSSLCDKFQAKKRGPTTIVAVVQLGSLVAVDSIKVLSRTEAKKVKRRPQAARSASLSN